jgi:SAM-dependent methyltransferase
MTFSFEDFERSGNLAVDPLTYELENAAIERDGRLDEALAEIAPWAGRDLLDVGCGNGYWLPAYGSTARSVVGVEPDPDLLEAAMERVAGSGNVQVRAGSAEHLPLADASVDVVHARFAYFFGQGAEQGLAEVRRVLRSGGVFAAIDNDWGWGDFASILRMAATGNAAIDPDETDAWWAARGATRTNIRAGWHARSPEELERVLRLELPGEVVDRFLSGRPSAARLSYGLAIFTIHG